MTTFTYPLVVKSSVTPVSTPPAQMVPIKVPLYMQRRVSVGDWGTATGATTIPLFKAPAGTRPWDGVLDVLTAITQSGTGTNFSVGFPAADGYIFAATTINTAGRRINTWNGTQVLANTTVFPIDTTIHAVVSIHTSTITDGEVLFTGVFL